MGPRARPNSPPVMKKDIPAPTRSPLTWAIMAGAGA